MGKGLRENLRSADMLSEEELRTMASNGGKKSAAVRRRKKLLRESLEYVINDMELPEALKAMLKKEGVQEEDYSHALVMARSMVAEAEKGNVSAFLAVRDSVGEKPVDEKKISGAVDTNVTIGFVETGIEPVSSEEEIDA